MNQLYKFIENLFFAPPVTLEEKPFLDLGEGETMCLTDSVLGTIVIADIGSGKTTLGRTIGAGLLSKGLGGLVLTVKESQINHFKRLCSEMGRCDDCIVFDNLGGHVFNPLQDLTSNSEAAELVTELADVMTGKTVASGNEDPFWRIQTLRILRNLFVLCNCECGKLDILVAAKLFDDRANTSADLSDPTWQKTSLMAKALKKVEHVRNGAEQQLAYEYFTKEFPSLGSPQGSLAAVVSGVFDHLRRPPLCVMFSGESTFNIDSILDDGKICIVGISVLSSPEGRMANAIMQHCFCKEATRRERENYSFLFSDECQETVTRELTSKLALFREFRVAPVLFTQNLAVLDARIGQVGREVLCGLMKTKIFGTQGHADTRAWASEQIDKERKISSTMSESETEGGASSTHNVTTSYQVELAPRVDPCYFQKLAVGQTILLRQGFCWSAHWPLSLPGEKGTVRLIQASILKRGRGVDA